MTARDFGSLVMEEGLRGRELAAQRRPESVKHEAAGCYDLRKAEAVKKSIDALAVALAASPDAKEFFLEMRGPGPIGDALSDGVRAAAREVMKQVDDFVIASFGMAAYSGFEPGKDGVFIVLPVSEPGRWKGFTWYTPGVHDEGGKDYGHWSFLADGATPANGKVENWFELLDSWFDVVDDAGGVNGYRW